MGDLQTLFSLDSAPAYLRDGGAVLWMIGALSVFALTLILWKLWRLIWLGAWRGARADQAARLWRAHQDEQAYLTAQAGRGAASRLALAAIAAAADPRLTETAAREETTRIAKLELAQLRAGLRGLETVATIAPLLGLFGTVLGMIEAFQALQDTGARADPAALAGGIWEALLTTAAGMGVAIPASVALTWFESVVDGARLRMEDVAARIFARKSLDTSFEHS